MSPPHVAIIIVTFNGCADTLECLSSLRKLTYRNYSVVIVDQASRDKTCESVSQSFPEVTIIRSPTNDGFAAGNNCGIEFALGKGADLVFLLNNDTIVEAGLLEPLISTALGDATIGVVGPAMLYYDAPETVWSAGGTIGQRGESVMRAQGQSIDVLRNADPANGIADVDFVVGCGMLIRRAVLEQVGVMDERFFLYYEESDLCARAKRAGWRIVTDLSSSLWHKISRSTGTDSELTMYYMRRNVLLYVEKNARDSRAARLRVGFDACRLGLFYWRTGRWRRAAVLLRANLDYLLRRFGRSDWVSS